VQKCKKTKSEIHNIEPRLQSTTVLPTYIHKLAFEKHAGDTEEAGLLSKDKTKKNF
jgi:hypothetical protein